MAKKSKQPKKFSAEEIEAAVTITHQEYFMQIISLLSHDETNKEFTYAKVPITTPDGGTYLISIIHIEGPKINLQKLGQAADASLENKNPAD